MALKKVIKMEPNLKLKFLNENLEILFEEKNKKRKTTQDINHW